MKKMSMTMVALGFAMMVFATGCGKGNVDVKISSEPVSLSGTAGRFALEESFSEGAGISALTGVTNFSFCVNRVRLEGEDDQPIPSDDDSKKSNADSNDITFAPGLITIENGVAKEWGVASLPAGFKLKRIKVKVHRDRDLCGVDYSVSYNGVKQTEDVEFKFRFEPAVELDSGSDTITLSLNQVVSVLRNAAEIGENNLKSHIEGAEGSARVK